MAHGVESVAIARGSAWERYAWEHRSHWQKSARTHWNGFAIVDNVEERMHGNAAVNGRQ